MNVYRSDTTLRIEIPETDEVVEVSFPNTVRVCYGTKRYEIVADDLAFILGAIEHHLARLAVNAADAERYAKFTGRPRWLVYNTETGHSYETPYEVEGSPKVEYNGKGFVWNNA